MHNGHKALAILRRAYLAAVFIVLTATPVPGKHTPTRIEKSVIAA
jgi:hypothetical protein